MIRLPSFRRPLDVLFLLGCLAVTIYVVAPEVWGHGKNKDYPLWYWMGQRALHGQNLYDDFQFIYPPFAAYLLAIPSYFGSLFLVLSLCILNSVAWWITLDLSTTMTGEDRPLPAWLVVLPSLATLSFVYDTYDLGQPNLLLLALMLIGFRLLQLKRPWLSGVSFALAISIKAFPVAVLPYLLWRRRWICALSLVLFTGLFTLGVPAIFKGPQRSVAEVTTWMRGMAGSEDGFGQRGPQNWSWKNQSLIAMTHRITRPIGYNQEEPNEAPKTMNLFNLDYRQANLVVVALALLIGGAFVAVMLPASRLTMRTEGDEIGILLCLMTLASPLARQYYFVWLIFPVTVLMHRAAFDPRSGARWMTWGVLGLAAALMLLSLPFFPIVLQAMGNNFAATTLIALALAWHMRHEPSAAMAAVRSITGKDGLSAVSR